jgi:hypothetical protein
LIQAGEKLAPLTIVLTHIERALVALLNSALEHALVHANVLRTPSPMTALLPVGF